MFKTPRSCAVVSNQEQFLNMLTGVAVGSEFCGAESPAIRDPGVWVVDVGKL